MHRSKTWSPSFFVVCLVAFLVVAATGNADEKLKRLPLGTVTADGWLHRQLERSKAGMGGHLDELEPEMIGKPYVDRNHKSKVVPGWSGEISGTYWTGLVQLAFTLDDPELKAKADKWVHGVLALQEKDGYLGSYRPGENRLEDYSAWSANWCYRALLAWYEATGEENVLDAVHRGLVWYTEHWKGEQKTEYAGPTLVESMIDVYLKTRDERLALWCYDYVHWLDRHDRFRHGKASLERKELQFNEDHVVAFGENVKMPALVGLANGDPKYLAASRNGIRQVMDKCWQCSGAPSSNFEYLSPPGANHETEYCNFATWLNTFSRMGRITGEAVWGDRMERILFNGAEGARKKDERAIAYNTSPNQFQASMGSTLFGNGSSFGVYAPNFSVACCPAQSVRIIPEYIRGMILKDASGNLFFSAYGPVKCEYTAEKGNKIQIRQETAWPFDETITFRVKTTAPWSKSFNLKLPDWCHKYRITLNGAELAPVAKDGWITVSHEWKEDTLTVTFVMEPKIVDVKDACFTRTPLRAVEYGPLLFALKYEEKWTPVAGHPLTALPKDWSWFDLTCAHTPGFFSFPAGNRDDWVKKIVVKRKPFDKTNAVYPWEESPLTLEVPLVRTQQYAYPCHFPSHRHTLLPYENPVTPDDGAKVQNVALVPFGSTVLRLACFTTAKE